VKLHDREGFTTFFDIKVFAIMVALSLDAGLVGLLGWLGLLAAAGAGNSEAGRAAAGAGDSVLELAVLELAVRAREREFAVMKMAGMDRGELAAEGGR
jgi:hypothetical protein